MALWMCQDAASSGEVLGVMGLGWSIFGGADGAAQERGQLS